MPREKIVTLYTYDELPDERAKEKAREWYRRATEGDTYFAEGVTEDFLEALKALGFTTRKNDLSWSGFWSQGDGAAFAGTWYRSDFTPDKLLADRPAEWVDESGKKHTNKANAELHRIAGELRECADAGLSSAVVEMGRGHFMRLNSAEIYNPDTEESDDAPEELAEKFIEAARDLAAMFYRSLEAEYEYQNSDEVVEEIIRANEYTFLADGKRED